uniref:Uncharacterized protein n=1 Tax=Rhizophora mucronata TaxID=61149 RepID=A0A2P2PFU6_RHIMU
MILYHLAWVEIYSRSRTFRKVEQDGGLVIVQRQAVVTRIRGSKSQKNWLVGERFLELGSKCQVDCSLVKRNSRWNFCDVQFTCIRYNL